MKINKQIQKIVNQLMKTSFKNGDVIESKIMENVKTLKTLPMPDSVMALSEYLRRVKSEVQRSTLVIESTIPVSSLDLKQITEAMKADYHISHVQAVINPSLIGGLRIKIGDVVFDDSVANKILQLREEIRT